MGKRIICIGLLLLCQLIGGWWGTPPALALTEEQKLFNEAWRIVSQAYLDESFNHQNWWLLRQKALKQPLANRETTYGAIQALLATLEDPFTRLLRPAQYRSLQTSTTGELTGVGLQIMLNSETGYLEVIAAIAGSPAAAAGLESGDQILAIDGTPTLELTLDEAAERMRGPAKTSVILRVQRQDREAAPQDLELIRDRIALNPIQTALYSGTDGRAIGYIRLNQFNANAASEMAQAIQHLEAEGVDAYLLDLRNNPGGLLQAGIEIAQLWLEPGPIVYTVDRQGIVGSFSATGAPLTSDPLVVLVNRGTASASEILAGALQDRGRAKLVGDRTYGKGLIQSLFNLSDGSGLAVTIAKYETPLHHDIHKIGIQPDQVVTLDPISYDQVGTEADRQFQAALKLLTAHPVLAGAPQF